MPKPHLRARITSDGFEGATGAPTAHDGASNFARDMIAWQPSRRSADAEILPEWNSMVGRTRDLDRNAPMAKGARRVLTDSVIGSGLRLSARPDYLALKRDKQWAVDWSREVESLFKSWWWTPACDARQMFCGDQLSTLSLAGEIMNGSSLTLPMWVPERGDGFATKLQCVDADRLGNPWGRPDSRNLRGGIKLDEYGAPVSYFVQKRHPGDTLVDSYANVNEWVEIPRFTEFGRARVIHAFDPDRTEQTRGKPLLAGVIPQFKQLDRYTRAELDAAVANALIAMVMQTPLDQDSIIELFSKDSGAYLKARQEHAVRLQSGTILSAFPGDQIASFTPSRPNSGFKDFVTFLACVIGSPIGIAPEQLLNNWSDTTYTSARMALIEAWRSFMRRRDWFTTLWLDPIYALFVEEVVNDGRLEAPGFDDYATRYAYLRCRWIGPGKGQVDPVKDATGAALRVQNGWSTDEDECAELGRDWRETYEQRAYELEERKRLNLPEISVMKPMGPEPDPAAATNEDDKPGAPKRPEKTGNG